MSILLHVLFGFLFSFLGSITPSMLNMTALKISLEKNKKESYYYSLGVSLIVCIQAYIAILLTKYIYENPTILESLEKAYSAKTKALLVTNPNNPTGYVLTEDEMDIIVDFVKAEDILLISDEIYEDTASKKDYKSFSKYTNLKKNLIILNGFSKSHAMTGFRIGYLLADLSLTKHFVKVHQYSVTSATTISQYAALEAIMTPFENLSNILKERRDYLLTRLEQMGITVNVSKGAFYLFPNISKFGMSSEEFCIKLLKENKLALIPGEYFLGNHTEYVRISYAAPIQVLEQAMNRLEAFLSNM